MPQKEIFNEKDIPEGAKPIATRKFSLTTLIRDAEKLAFNQARKFAKKIGSKIIYYKNYSGANPDFMDGDDSAKPQYYDIEAIFY